MYIRPRFLEELHAIREEMSRECDYDMDLFAAYIRNNARAQRVRLKAEVEADASVSAAIQPSLKSPAPRKTKRR